MVISPFAGKPAEPWMLIDVPKLLAAYFSNRPDPSVPAQRVSFGTSGHRGSSLTCSFNEWHILAISAAICLYRKKKQIDGPLFIGIDTHALSEPAFATALEVFAANQLEVMISKENPFTPTPVISHAILRYNQGRQSGLADGIVITPSHNPPHDGGFKYNTPNGGPAGPEITQWIEAKANELLEDKLSGIKRIPFEKALKLSTTHLHDYRSNYISDLSKVIDMDLIAQSNINIGVDPLGGAGVNYWEPIAKQYGLNLSVVSKVVDPTFSFMTVDWDGQIRMDPSSPYAMARLIKLKDQFDISMACDTDHDRHGIVTKNSGLLPPNHYLSAAIFYLFSKRHDWDKDAMVGKTVVSSQMIDRVTSKLGKKLFEVPVGFKWFEDGLANGSLGFGGEESAGASFSRIDGKVWTTDKDGIILALLSAEITAAEKKDPGEIYSDLVNELGESFYDRIDAAATPSEKEKIAKLSAGDIKQNEMAGEKIISKLTNAPGNGAPIGGLKVITENGWFAARPSGTENIYKIYAESFRAKEHLENILTEAETIVKKAIGG
jgi:phosphoglucomutase